MKTGIGIGVIAVATVLVAVFLATRASGPTAVEATVDADGGLSFYGEGDTQTAPLDIVSWTICSARIMVAAASRQKIGTSSSVSARWTLTPSLSARAK
jgi:hypothetical protein